MIQRRILAATLPAILRSSRFSGSYCPLPPPPPAFPARMLHLILCANSSRCSHEEMSDVTFNYVHIRNNLTSDKYLNQILSFKEGEGGRKERKSERRREMYSFARVSKYFINLRNILYMTGYIEKNLISK